jgi:hypothetical protein
MSRRSGLPRGSVTQHVEHLRLDVHDDAVVSQLEARRIDLHTSERVRVDSTYPPATDGVR